MSNPNMKFEQRRIGLDKVTDQRNRIVEIEVADPTVSALRDDVVLAIDVLTQVLIEHFPLMAETREPQQEER